MEGQGQNTETAATGATKSTRELAVELLREGIAKGQVNAAISYLQLAVPRGQAVETVVAAPPELRVSEEQRLRLIKMRKQLLKTERDDLSKLAKRRDKLNAEVASPRAAQGSATRRPRPPTRRTRSGRRHNRDSCRDRREPPRIL